MSPLSEPELTAALDRLVTAELVFRRGTPPEASYSFKHALVRDAAYESLLKSRRRQLHARIVAVLEECFPKRVENEPALLAVHCAEAGLAEKAVGYWYEAGQRALAQSAMMEAVAQLRRALELLAGLPLGPGRDRRELDLQLALGGALIAEIGWGVEETRRAYARARDLCRELDEIERLFPVLWGLTVYHINHAEMLPAVETAEEMLRLAECRDEVTLRLASHRAAATAYYHAGELTKARAHAEATLALYDRDRDRTLVYIYAADFRVLALSVLSLALLGLGYPDQASAARREAVAHARELVHPHSVGMALAFSGIFAFFARDFSDLLAHAEALMALAAEHGLQHYASKAALYRDCVQALAGGENAFERCRLGLAVHRVAGQEREVPICLTLMAEARRRAGRPEEALGLLDEPLDRLKRTREGWIEAELHRIRGELLLAQPKPDSNEAEACLRSALETARRQSAQMWELRAAQSLARLWIGQGKQRAARNLLAPVYGRFTEGFGTPDLQDAAALLRALGQGPC